MLPRPKKVISKKKPNKIISKREIEETEEPISKVKAKWRSDGESESEFESNDELEDQSKESDDESEEANGDPPLHSAKVLTEMASCTLKDL